ncbi:hypothetical protein [Sandarakinorhabdus sp. DWP1-3-1]|uniref:hypothetical protein n=1 Tax=Sandarakinorhabdus sp. DWP1-3-1 TaxID=2804627 RepID=UPI003CF3BC30
MIGVSGDHLLGVAGLTPGGAGVWTGVLIFLGVVVRSWPAIKLATINARIALGKEQRESGDWYLHRIEAMERRLAGTEAEMLDLKRKFTTSLAAYRMVVGELHGRDPKNKIIAMAQQLLGPDLMADLPETDPVGPVPA